jgi:hypothetical protein
MAGAWLVVRAVVADPADRAAFDDWYRREHLPDAVKAFSACTAWRGWSATDPSIHCAQYRFESLDRLEAVMSGVEIAELINEFDRHWNGRVTRTREILAVADETRELKDAGP